MIVLFLTLLGVPSQHQISAFSFDSGAKSFSYTEAGVQHSQAGMVIFSYTNSNGSATLVVKSDAIFANGFN
jgi:hypothetical protein